MFTRRCIQAAFGQPQAFYWLAADYVGVDDFFDVGLGYVSVPDGLGIDHEVRAVLALIQTSRLIGTDFAFEAALGEFLFE